MSQSLAKNCLHLTFSTKLRQPIIPPELRAEVALYLGGILKTQDSAAIEIKAVSDHVHVLFCLSRNKSLASVVEELKKGSSKWLKTKGGGLADFFWQAGYGAFSVSQSNVEAVRRYIVSQEEHHRKMTLEQELIELLKRHEIEYDERYLWA